MRTIFLDIDGVLNSGKYMKTGKFRKGKTFFEHNISMIDPKTVKILNSITDAVPATKIVLSSSWRIYRTPSISACNRLFNDVGVKARCIDLTRHYPDDVKQILWKHAKKTATQMEWVDQVRRGHEIHAWLIENPPAMHEPSSFVILDDNSDMEYLKHRLVQTKWSEGLTKADAKKAITMLKENHEF